MQGEQLVAASRERLWEALNDPAILQRSIPGCQQLERTADDGFEAVVEVKIGPIGARFKGKVDLQDLDPPNGYVIAGQGSGGVAGAAKGKARVSLSEAPGGTLLTWVAEVDTTGRLTQLGGPILDATARNLAAKFFDNLAAQLESDGDAPAPDGAAPAAVTAEPAAARHEAAIAGPVVASASPASRPWSVMVALGVALLAGFLLGQSEAADWWVVAVVLLAGVCVLVGYEFGQSRGRRG